MATHYKQITIWSQNLCVISVTITWLALQYSSLKFIVVFVNFFFAHFIIMNLAFLGGVSKGRTIIMTGFVFRICDKEKRCCF